MLALTSVSHAKGYNHSSVAATTVESFMLYRQRVEKMRSVTISCAYWIRSFAFILATGLLLVGMSGCQAPTPAASFVQQADRLHEGALASTVVSDTDLNDYLQEIVSRIARATEAAAPGKVNETFISHVRCHLVDCDTINAFSTGGSHIYVTHALFQQCQTEDELAAAIAHAYAHLVNLDIEATAMRPDASTPLSMVAWQFVVNRFTREQERNADTLAIKVYSKAGWETSQFAGLFERLESVNGGNVAPDRDSLPQRSLTLHGIAAQLDSTHRAIPVADPRTFASLRQRTAIVHEPSALTPAEIFLRAFPNCMLSGDTAEQAPRRKDSSHNPRLPCKGWSRAKS